MTEPYKLFIRTCQECGKEQEAKDPASYKDQAKEAWRETKCKGCKSEALDYGSWRWFKDGQEIVEDYTQ